MKLLKILIVILFFSSLLGAGVTFYLSTVRENEKEKRIYLEGVKAELELEKADLEGKVSDLELKNEDLARQLVQEKDAHDRTRNTIRKKDLNIQNLEGNLKNTEEAFESAQKRNQELERILGELEARMREAEAQRTPPTPETGYVQVSVTASGQPAEEVASESTASTIQAVEQAAERVTSTPVTALPTPPKPRSLYPFLRPHDQRSEIPPPPIAVPRPAPSPERKVVPAAKADQHIAAGSILLVNRKYNFVVVNLGTRQGLSLDDVLAIQKEGREIGKARVEKLYEDYCAAYIIEEQSGRPIGEGDAVTAA